MNCKTGAIYKVLATKAKSWMGGIKLNEQRTNVSIGAANSETAMQEPHCTEGVTLDAKTTEIVNIRDDTRRH